MSDLIVGQWRGKTKGHVPEDVRVFLRSDRKHKGPYGIETVCRPAFFANSKAKSFKAAENWVGPFGGHKGETIENDPYPMLTLVGLEIRGEGGRAYKVVTPDGYLVDLREDVLLECMFRNGVTKGRKGEPPTLKGPFQWVVNGTQMKLALVHAAREGDLTDSQINKPHGAAGDETDPIKRFLLLSNIKADGTPKYQVSFKPVIAKA